MVNGDYYQGSFKFDVFDGFGCMYSKNGKRYEGNWENDVYHGEGKEIWPDGS